MTLFDILKNHTGNKLTKWNNFFPIYDDLFEKYLNRSIRLLEIGCSHGGSLQIWQKFFHQNSLIVGLDINPICKQYETKNIKIYIGDQSDENVLNQIIKDIGSFDIIIDDGSHFVDHQIKSFNFLYPFLNSHGLYIVEDCLSSYKHFYGGGLHYKKSFIEFAKLKIDKLNNNHWDFKSQLSDKSTYNSIQFFNNLTIFNKIKNTINPHPSSYGHKKIVTSVKMNCSFRKRIYNKFLKIRNYIYINFFA